MFDDNKFQQNSMNLYIELSIDSYKTKHCPIIDVDLRIRRITIQLTAMNQDKPNKTKQIAIKNKIFEVILAFE